jgi:hypothetical protein
MIIYQFYDNNYYNFIWFGILFYRHIAVQGGGVLLKYFPFDHLEYIYIKKKKEKEERKKQTHTTGCLWIPSPQ